jgi:hypothetical protein
MHLAGDDAEGFAVKQKLAALRHESVWFAIGQRRSCGCGLRVRSCVKRDQGESKGEKKKAAQIHAAYLIVRFPFMSRFTPRHEWRPSYCVSRIGACQNAVF